MKYIEGQPREQLTLIPSCLDAVIDSNNNVRLIDAFVDGLDLEKLGFKVIQKEGRPCYNPADLLKLYIYGYMNKVRSSRHLEKECHRNLEVIWLIKQLKPDHNTINRFRKDNPDAIKRVFRQTVEMAKNFNLIGALLIAGDSTKLRAQNSKKNNYNTKKIQRHLEYIDKKLEEHNKALATADGDEKQKIKKEIDKHNQRKENYKDLQNQLDESGQKQISTSDPDSRHQIVRNNITEVCYTAQTTTDDKHKIIIDYKLTNQNDKKAMGLMLQRAKTILRTNQFTALYDKGYHTGSEFAIAHRLGTKILVAVPGIGRSAQAPNPKYNAENFEYNVEKDCYTCPQGHQLTSNGTWYNKEQTRFKQYKTRSCKTCSVRGECTTAKHNGKVVQRTEHQSLIEQNFQRIEKHPKVYKKRQSIVEHPYGTIKRQWGFDHVLTKQFISRASADVGFIFTAYNLKRIFNVLSFKTLMQQLHFLISHLIFISALKKPFTSFKALQNSFFQLFCSCAILNFSKPQLDFFLPTPIKKY